VFSRVIIATSASLLLPFVPANGAPSQLREVTVADVIGSTEFVRQAGGNAVLYSPNGKRFVVETRKGNASNNTNAYSLLLFEAESAHRSSVPNVLIRLPSSSNSPAIQSVKWVGDDTIAFLSNVADGVQQLFTLDCKTKELTKLTAHATDVVAYAISVSGDSFFFIAKTMIQSLLTQRTVERGIIVSEQELSDLIALRDQRASDEHQVLFKQSKRGGPESVVQTGGINGFSAFGPPPELSPDGRHLIIKTVVPDAPPREWSNYQDRILQGELTQGHFERQMASYEFEVVDAVSGERRILLNAPSGYGHSEFAWSADSRSVVISGTYLPLDGNTEDEERKRSRYVVEIDLLDGSVTPITNQDVRLQRWDAQTNTLLFRKSIGFSSDSPAGVAVGYRKKDGVWKKVEVDERDLPSINASVKGAVEQDANTPPKLLLENAMTGKWSVLLDPNPQFKTLRFARVESISFRASNGSMAKGALYFPANYVAGRKYPLVVQTHASNLQRFAIDGPFPTAFAAQPLAGRGIAVVQLEEDWTRLEAQGEVTDEVAVYEGVLDYLCGRGIVDSARVGLIGFSRTGLAVEYMLTHSSYPVSAASLADISDAGYFRYIARIKDPGSARDSEIINGGIPFGKGLESWLKTSPDFNLDKVRTPVLMSAQSPISLLYVWEWFAGLSRLERPVELLYMPDADHVLVKPQDRIISQGGNVDWFDFWLTGHEDPDPAKMEQYKRWEKLCDMQVAQNLNQPAFCVRTKAH
jgi:hypothetical protein